MNQNEIHALLDSVVASRGIEETAHILNEYLAEQPEKENTLTIISNTGIHVIPERYLRGEVYSASYGNWDAESQETLMNELKIILTKLAKKLRSTSWNKVYLVPTGHPILSLHIKALVYRLLRLNTIDLYYKKGIYFYINIDQRDLVFEEPLPAERNDKA